MKKLTTVYPLLLQGADARKAEEALQIIEDASCSGPSPRPVTRAIRPLFTENKTLLYVTGCVGNYAQRIIGTLKEKGFNAKFIDDDLALKVENRQDPFA